MRTIHTEGAPAAIGPYSQAKVWNQLVFTSGQIPLDPKTGLVVGVDIEAQTDQALANLVQILNAAGASTQTVLKTTCFLADMTDFGGFNKVYERYFPGKPSRSCVAVRALPKGVLVEVEAVAFAAE